MEYAFVILGVLIVIGVQLGVGIFAAAQGLGIGLGRSQIPGKGLIALRPGAVAVAGGQKGLYVGIALAAGRILGHGLALNGGKPRRPGRQAQHLRLLRQAEGLLGQKFRPALFSVVALRIQIL